MKIVISRISAVPLSSDMKIELFFPTSFTFRFARQESLDEIWENLKRCIQMKCFCWRILSFVKCAVCLLTSCESQPKEETRLNNVTARMFYASDIIQDIPEIHEMFASSGGRKNQYWDLISRQVMSYFIVKTGWKECTIKNLIILPRKSKARHFYGDCSVEYEITQETRTC